MTQQATRTARPNWFPCLNDALASEGLVELWPLGENLNYGESKGLILGDRYVSIYRETNGMYERPVHYGVKLGARA